MLDELLYVNPNEMIGITIAVDSDMIVKLQIKNDFGVSLLTLGTGNKIFVVDFYKLHKSAKLDKKLREIFMNSPGIFVGYGVSTIIYQVMQSTRTNYLSFLKEVPRILDARIIYHKIYKKGQ